MNADKANPRLSAFIGGPYLCSSYWGHENYPKRHWAELSQRSIESEIVDVEFFLARPSLGLI